MIEDKLLTFYKSLVVENGKLEIPSIFMFSNQGSNFHLFLNECKNKNCTVYFKNEDLTYIPNDLDSNSNYKFMAYQAVISDTSILKNYEKYMQNLKNMTFDKIKTE